MRVELLSDHGGQQLEATRRQLRAAEERLDARRRGYRQAHREYLAARHGRPLWRRLLGRPTSGERQARARAQGAWQQVLSAEHGSAQLQHRAAQQSAGVYGEDALSQALSGLSDEWVMLRGYRNHRGETDHVLVGPPGLWVVEVKRRRVRLHARADEWWYEKVDNYGNVVETGWAVDGGGRSWARQVTDVAGALASWLDRNGHRVPVRTGVMLMHERAQLGRCRDLTIDLLACQPRHLLRAIMDSPAVLNAQECLDIVRLVRRDHRYHARRRHLA